MFLRYIGCVYVRQQGSHMIYRRADLRRPIVLPKKKNVTVGVIAANLRTLGISKERYVEIMRSL